MSSNHDDKIIIYINIGLQLTYIISRIFVDYFYHKKINNIKRHHKTIIIKNQLLHEKIDNIINSLSKNKIESNEYEDN